MSELRVTDTNSVNDSKGRALGLEGNDFLYVIGGFVGAFACYLLLDMMLGAATLPSILLSLPILVLPTAWVLLFRHNKPDGYAEDFFDQLVTGEGWSFVARNQPVHPGCPCPTVHEKRRT
jgi:hypothetical protein